MTAPFDYLKMREAYLPGNEQQSAGNMSDDYLQKRKRYLDSTMADYQRIQQLLHQQGLHDPTNSVGSQVNPNDPINQQIQGMYQRGIEPPSVFDRADQLGRAKALGIKNPETLSPSALAAYIDFRHKEGQPQDNNLMSTIGSGLLTLPMGVLRGVLSTSEKIENLKPQWLKDLTRSEQAQSFAREKFAQLDQSIRNKLSPSEEKVYGFFEGAGELGYNTIPYTLGYRLFGAMFGAPALGTAIKGFGPAVRSSLAWMASAAANEAGSNSPWLPNMSMKDVQSAFQGDLVNDPAARKNASNLFLGNRAAIIAQAGLFPFMELGLRNLFGGSRAPNASTANVRSEGGRPALAENFTDPWDDVPYADFEIMGSDAIVRRQGGGGGGTGGAGGAPSPVLGDRYLRRLGPGESVVEDISGHSTPPAPPTPAPTEPVSPAIPLEGPIGPFRDQYGRPQRLTTTPEDAMPRLVELQDRRQRFIDTQDALAREYDQLDLMPNKTPEIVDRIKQLRTQMREQADLAMDAHRDINALRLSAGLHERDLPTFWDLLKKNPLSPFTPTAEMVLAAGTTVQQGGRPIETYHGTAVSDIISAQGLNEEKLGWNDPERNLFSPGFYSHTNPLAAGGDPFNPLKLRGYAFERMDDLNFQRQQLEKRIQEHKTTVTDLLQNGGSQEQIQMGLQMVSQLKQQLAAIPTPAPGVMRTYLMHRKTFLADEAIPVEEALQILRTASEMPELEGFDFNALASDLTKGYAQYRENDTAFPAPGMVNGSHFFEQLAALEDQRIYDPDADFAVGERISSTVARLNKARAGLVLEAAGYDGIRYMGGMRMGTGPKTHAYVTFRAKNVVPVFMDDPVLLEEIGRNLGIQTQKREAILESPSLEAAIEPTQIGDVQVVQAQVASDPGSVNVLRGVEDIHTLLPALEQGKEAGIIKDFRIVASPTGRLDAMVNTLGEIEDAQVNQYTITGFFDGQDVLKSSGAEAKISKIDLETRKAFVKTAKQAVSVQPRGNWVALDKLLPYTSGRGIVEAPEFYDAFRGKQLANAAIRAEEAGVVDYTPTLWDDLVAKNIRNDLFELFKEQGISDKGMQAALERYVDQRRIEDARQLDPEYAQALGSLEQEADIAESVEDAQNKGPLPDELPVKALLRGYTLSTNIGQPGYTLHKVDSPDVIPFMTEEAVNEFLQHIDTQPDDITPPTNVPMEIGDLPSDLHSMTEGDANDIFAQAEADAPIINEGFKTQMQELGMDFPDVEPEDFIIEPEDYLSALEPETPAGRRGYMAPSATVEWATPQKVFDSLNARFKFTLDAAASPTNAKVNRFYTKAQNGLAQDWSGETVWLNPPYGRELADWMRKAYEESQKGATVVSLIPVRSDTQWWHDYVMKGDVYLVKGRMKFGAGTKDAPFPVAISVLGPNIEGEFGPMSFLRTGENTVGVGFDPSIFEKMGAGMYGNKITSVITKEAIQNAVDAVEHLGDRGHVWINIVENKNEITVEDNGHGMTPDVAAKELVDVAASLKTNANPRGSFGLAKIGMYARSKLIDITTTTKVGDDSYLQTHLTGSNQDWINGTMKIESYPVDAEDAFTGTRMRLQLEDPKADDQSYTWYNPADFVRHMVQHSNLPTNFHFTRHPSWGGVDKVESKEQVNQYKPEVSTVSVPGGILKFRVSYKESTGDMYGANTKIHILNNGLYQTSMGESVRAGKAPADVQVDVQSTVPTTSSEYPWTTSREDVKANVKDAIREFVNNIHKQIKTKELEEQVNVFANAKPVGNTTGKVYVLSSKPQMAALGADVANSRYAERLMPIATEIYTRIAAMASPRYPALLSQPGFFGGIGHSKDFLGVNIHSLGLTKDASAMGMSGVSFDQNMILLSPHAIAMETQGFFPNEFDTAFNDNPEDRTPAAGLLAQATWQTLVHELVHQIERGHGKEFASVHTRIPGYLVFYAPEAVQQLTAWWHETLGDPDFLNDYELFNAEGDKENVLSRYSGHEDRSGVDDVPQRSSQVGRELQPPEGYNEFDSGAGDESSAYLRPDQSGQAQDSGQGSSGVQRYNAAGGGSGIVPPNPPVGGAGGFLPRPDKARAAEMRKGLADITDGLRGFQRTYLLPMRNSFQWLEDQMTQLGFTNWRPAAHFDAIVAATDFARNQGFDLHIDTNWEIAKVGSQHLRSGKAWRVFEQHNPQHAHYYARQWGMSDGEYVAIRNTRRLLENQIGAGTVRDWIDYIGHLRNEQQSNNFARSIYDPPQGNNIGYFADYARKRAMKFGGSPDLRWAVPEFIRSYYYGLHAAPVVKEATDFYKAVRNVEVRGEQPFKPLADFFLDWAQYIETGYKPGLDVAARLVSKLFGKFTTMSETQAREFINFMMRQTYRAMLGWRAHTVIRDSLQLLMAAPVVGGEYLDRAITALVRQGPEYDLMKARAYSHATVQKGVIKTGMQEWGEATRIGDQGAFHALTDEATTTVIDRLRDMTPPQLRSISGTKLDPLWLYGKENLAVRMVMGEAAYQRFSDVFADYMRGARDSLVAGTPETMPNLDDVIKKLNMGGYSPSIQRRVKELIANGDPEAAAGVYMREVCNDAAMIFGNINTPPGLRGSTARLAMTLGHFAQGMYGFLDRTVRYARNDPRMFARTMMLLGGITAATELLRKETGLNFRNWNPATAPATFSGSPMVRTAVGAYNAVSGIQQAVNASPFAEPRAPDLRLNPISMAGNIFPFANPAQGLLQNYQGITASMESPDPAAGLAGWFLTGDRRAAAVSAHWADQLVDSLLTSRSPAEYPAHRMPGANQFQYQRHGSQVPLQEPQPQPTDSGGGGGKGAF